MSHTQYGSSQVDREGLFRQKTEEVDAYSEQVCSTPVLMAAIDSIATCCVALAGVYTLGSVAYKALYELRWRSKRAIGVLATFAHKQHQSMGGGGGRTHRRKSLGLSHSHLLT